MPGQARPAVPSIVLTSLLACASCVDRSTGVEAGTETAETETGGEPDDHGTIRVELVPSNGDASIFDDTAAVIATVHYESCLQDFYLNEHPEYQDSGPDGAPVFADFAARLCSEFADTPACSVTDITQNLFPDNQVYSVTVTFAIDDPATLADRELRLGPLPTAELAGCSPRVELRQTGLLGRDAGGLTIWRIAALPGSNSAETDQGAPLRAELSAN